MMEIICLVGGALLGWCLRGYRSVTLDDVARMMEAADRDEPIEQRVRRASRKI